MAQRGRVGIVATIATLAVAGCASTVTRPSAVATTSPTPVATTPSPSPTPSLPIPTGFQPVSLSAISESDFWVLGRAPCATVTGCPSQILHTVNGGKTFRADPRPGHRSISPARAPGDCRRSATFASPTPPTAGRSATDQHYVTHDGGAHWYELNPRGHSCRSSRAPTDRCTRAVQICLDPRRRRQAVPTSWCGHRRTTTPGVSYRSPVTRPDWPSIGVHGDTVWVMYFERSTGLAWTSHDDGEIWDYASMPCEPDLGGLFDPVSTNGHLGVLRNWDAGRRSGVDKRRRDLHTHEGPRTAFGNGSFVAALSSHEAFVGRHCRSEVTTKRRHELSHVAGIAGGACGSASPTRRSATSSARTRTRSHPNSGARPTPATPGRWFLSPSRHHAFSRLLIVDTVTGRARARRPRSRTPQPRRQEMAPAPRPGQMRPQARPRVSSSTR